MKEKKTSVFMHRQSSCAVYSTVSDITTVKNVCICCVCEPVSVDFSVKYIRFPHLSYRSVITKLTLKLKVHLVNFTHSLNYVTFYALGEAKTKKKYKKQRGAIICMLGNYGQSN